MAMQFDFAIPLSNYYGIVRVHEIDGRCFMSLDDWDGTDRIEISRTLYAALLNEFVTGLST